MGCTTHAIFECTTLCEGFLSLSTLDWQIIVMESSPEGGTSSRSGGISSAGGGHFPLPLVGKTLSIRCSPASSGVDFRLYLLHVFIFKSKVFFFFISWVVFLFFVFTVIQGCKHEQSLTLDCCTGLEPANETFFYCLGGSSCGSNKSKSKCVLWRVWLTEKTSIK